MGRDTRFKQAETDAAGRDLRDSSLLGANRPQYARKVGEHQVRVDVPGGVLNAVAIQRPATAFAKGDYRPVGIAGRRNDVYPDSTK